MQDGAVFLGRYAGQPRSEVRAMPLSAYRRWLATSFEYVKRDRAHG